MSVLYLVASLIFLMATTVCFRANVPHREAIDAALDHGKMLTPERMWPYYDADYLNIFISNAKEKRTSLGKSVLGLYIRPTLLWIDIGFAIFCAAFAALFWLGFLSVLPDYPVIKRLMVFLIAMSMIYGVADVAEDLWLVRLFSRSRKVTKMEGAIACALTETKLVTISLSLAGGLLFLVLDRTFSKREGPT